MNASVLFMTIFCHIWCRSSNVIAACINSLPLRVAVLLVKLDRDRFCIDIEQELAHNSGLQSGCRLVEYAAKQWGSVLMQLSWYSRNWTAEISMWIPSTRRNLCVDLVFISIAGVIKTVPFPEHVFLSNVVCLESSLHIQIVRLDHVISWALHGGIQVVMIFEVIHIEYWCWSMFIITTAFPIKASSCSQKLHKLEKSG